jgi:sporulation protein YlmC with PRC-barrel domain
MDTREIRLDLLLNRRVYDADGAVIGRLEEVVAEPASDALGAYYAVREYHVGKYALLESLAGGAFARAVMRLFGGRAYQRYAVPWDRMDLSDLARPRATVRRAELRRA